MRLWMTAPGDQALRRRALHSTASTNASTTDGLGLLLFDNPELQAAATAAAWAETAAAAAAALQASEATAESVAPPTSAAAAAAAEAASENALNPLGLSPMLLAAARYGSMGLASEAAAEQFDNATLSALTGGNSSAGQQVSALAVPGSLDYYLYGDNPLVYSGQNYSERCPDNPLLLAVLNVLARAASAALPTPAPNLHCRCLPQKRPHPLCFKVSGSVSLTFQLFVTAIARSSCIHMPDHLFLQGDCHWRWLDRGGALPALRRPHQVEGGQALPWVDPPVPLLQQLALEPSTHSLPPLPVSLPAACAAQVCSDAPGQRV